jgi:endonuclease/exonuclease/phosphatase family metal-dependent hydrolase
VSRPDDPTAGAASAAPAASETMPRTLLNVATFNIRYDNAADGVNAWPNRREWVRDLIDYHGFDVVGVQEALAHQLDFLTSGRLAAVGVGRDDGKRAGEFSAVLYDRERFERKGEGTFWLSETPETPSKGWDADCVRVCTWARLRDRAAGANGREFVFVNTHLDHKGQAAKEKGTDLILERLPKITGGLPFVVTGDLNSRPEDAPVRKLAAALRDARAASETKPYGPAGTFSGFDVKRPLDAPIDYVFVGPGVRVLRYAVLPDNWGGRYPSDHLPVAVRLAPPA